jgi:hypothetical protein
MNMESLTCINIENMHVCMYLTNFHQSIDRSAGPLRACMHAVASGKVSTPLRLVKAFKEADDDGDDAVGTYVRRLTAYICMYLLHQSSFIYTNIFLYTYRPR